MFKILKLIKKMLYRDIPMTLEKACRKITLF